MDHGLSARHWTDRAAVTADRITPKSLQASILQELAERAGQQHTGPKQEREGKVLGFALRGHAKGTTSWHSVGSQGRARDPTLLGSALGLPLQREDNAQVTQVLQPQHICLCLFHCLCALHVFLTGIIKSVFSAPKWAVPVLCH